jgi:hypothetical protein
MRTWELKVYPMIGVQGPQLSECVRRVSRQLAARRGAVAPIHHRDFSGHGQKWGRSVTGSAMARPFEVSQ